MTLLGGRRVLHEAAAAAAGGRHARSPSSPSAWSELRAVNEREGYAAGDALLVGAARKLRRAAARFGATAFRDGGDRLAVLAPGLDDAGAQRLADEVAAEFGLGPAIAVSVAVRRPGQDADARARRRARGPRAALAAAAGAKAGSEPHGF